MTSAAICVTTLGFSRSRYTGKERDTDPTLEVPLMHFVHGLNIFMFIALGFALVFGVGTIVLTVRLQLRLRHQAGLARSEFIAAMPARGAETAQYVFDEYRKESYSSDFKLSPECDLRRAFAQDSEDIFDTAKQIAARLGFRSPTHSDFSFIAANDSFTARNLVEFLMTLAND